MVDTPSPVVAIRRVALLTMHTCPLAQPGTGDGGGLNVYVLEVARNLAQRGVEVDVFTRTSSPSAPATVEVTPRLLVHHVVAGPPGPVAKERLLDHLPAFALGVMRHPRAGLHQVVHAHYWLSGLAGRLLVDRWRVPLVQTFHTLGVVKNAVLAPGDAPEPRVRLAVERRVAASADRLAVLTCGEARLVHRTFGVSGARIDVVPAGVDLARFHAGPARSVPGIPDGEGPVLLFAGRLQPLKAPDVAVETLARVRAEFRDARLLVVGGTSGSGDGRSGPAELRELAASLGVREALTIVPALPQDVLAELYRRADVVLVPSRSESFGLVALEAQASGVPVVAADVGGLSTVVRDGGTLVAGHDPADHAEAVLRYLRDPDLRVRTGEAGRRAASLASWDRTADALLEVYADAARVPEPAARELRGTG